MKTDGSTAVRDWLLNETDIPVGKGSLFPIFANTYMLAKLLHERYPKQVNLHCFAPKPGASKNISNWFTFKGHHE